MKDSPNLSHNFALVKPDGILYVAGIIQMFTNAGLHVQSGDPLVPTEEQIRKHFRINNADYTKAMGKKFCDNCRQGGLPLEKVAELIGFSFDHPAYTFNDIHQKAGEILFTINSIYFLSGKVIPLVISGTGDVISLSRNITGPTNPAEAGKETIRGRFSNCNLVEQNKRLQPCQNVIHASGTPEERDEELEIWWPNRKK